MARYVPLIKKCFNKFNEKLGFVGININYEIDVFFHVCADISDFTHRINGFPCCCIKLILDSFNFIDKPWFRNLPKVANYSL